MASKNHLETMDYITPIKEILDYWMHDRCRKFMLIGFPNKSPRWFNYGDFNQETKELTIKSTQVNLGFTIPTEFRFVVASEFWQQFKEYRTDFLLSNYPTIDVY